MEGEYVPLGQDAGGSSGVFSYLMIILIFVAVYFFMIRPQNKRRREVQELQSRVGPGDDIITTSGLYGTVVSVDDDSITIEASPGVNLRMHRGSVGNIVTPKPDVEETTSDEDDDDDNADAKKTIEKG